MPKYVILEWDEYIQLLEKVTFQKAPLEKDANETTSLIDLTGRIPEAYNEAQVFTKSKEWASLTSKTALLCLKEGDIVRIRKTNAEPLLPWSTFCLHDQPQTEADDLVRICGSSLQSQNK